MGANLFFPYPTSWIEHLSSNLKVPTLYIEIKRSRLTIFTQSSFFIIFSVIIGNYIVFLPDLNKYFLNLKLSKFALNLKFWFLHLFLIWILNNSKSELVKLIEEISFKYFIACKQYILPPSCLILYFQCLIVQIKILKPPLFLQGVQN